jgi:hypothetical protein
MSWAATAILTPWENRYSLPQSTIICTRQRLLPGPRVADDGPPVNQQCQTLLCAMCWACLSRARVCINWVGPGRALLSGRSSWALGSESHAVRKRKCRRRRAKNRYLRSRRRIPAPYACYGLGSEPSRLSAQNPQISRRSIRQRAERLRAGRPRTLQFAAMRPTAAFVSIGRGSVVDEAALAAAVRSGWRARCSAGDR